MAYRNPQKGGFILEDLVENAGSFIFIPFIFNPEELDENESANYAMHEIPGRADPYIQYVSGTGLSLAFTLIVDLERIKELASYTSLTNRYAGEQIPAPVIDVFENRSMAKFSDFSLTDSQIRGLETYVPDTADLYIEQVRKLILPRETDDWFVKSPPRVLFVMGSSTFKGRIKDINIIKYLFTPRLETKYAELSINMIRDNKEFPRFFSRLPKSIQDIKLPFGSEGDINNDSYVDRRKGYISR